MAAARSRSPETTGGDSNTAIDVYSAAIVLVREYGAELAPTMAAKRAHLLFAKGDRLGCIVWRGVVNAAREVTRIPNAASASV